MGHQLQQEPKFEWLEQNTTGTNDDAAYEWSDADEEHGRQTPPSQALQKTSDNESTLTTQLIKNAPRNKTTIGLPKLQTTKNYTVPLE
jgi:hypothetical protein